MAMQKKKHKKPHHMRRNAVRRNAVATLPQATVIRRKPTAGELLEAEQARHQEDSRGWRLVNGIGGAVVTGIAEILLERQSVLPVSWTTLAVSGLGAALALGAPNKTVRSFGVGAATAGTALFGRLVAHEEWPEGDPKKTDHPHVASSAPSAKPPTPGKKQSNSTDIPADALARAYERARLRMALASDPAN
jgi:hypothetical protein